VKLRQVRLASVPGLPDRIRKALVEYGLDREFGRPDSWAASVEKKYTEVDGWAVEELILNYWRISLRYLHVPGEAISRFLNGLKEGRITGTQCDACGRVLIPPRHFCEWCFRRVDRWVEHPGTGTVSTYSFSYIGTDPGVRLEKPEIVAVIWFDGTVVKRPASKTVVHAAGILHRLRGVEPSEVRVGMAVKPVWRRERVGSILDIDYFEPAGGGSV
jgi:uncharacterized OB-fold protein